MDILAIQQTHIKETKVTELEEYVLFTSGGKSRYRVGFLVSKELKKKIAKFEPISDKMCRIELQGETNLSILNIHAPTEEKPKEVKEEFYEKLENEYNKQNKRSVKIIMGDMNNA